MFGALHVKCYSSCRLLTLKSAIDNFPQMKLSNHEWKQFSENDSKERVNEEHRKKGLQLASNVGNKRCIQTFGGETIEGGILKNRREVTLILKWILDK